MSNILVTGGAGFIGSHLVNSLINSGNRVWVIDSLSPQIHGEDPKMSPLLNSLDSRVDFIQGSITSKSLYSGLIDEIDIVIHLASETGTGQSMYEIEKYADVNVLGTAYLLEAILNSSKRVKKIIVASTRAVYGEGKYFCVEHGNVYPESRSSTRMQVGIWDLFCKQCDSILVQMPTDEESHLNPQSIYGITKLTQEQMILAFGKAYDLSAVSLRLQNVFGPGQSLSNPYTGILSVFSTRLLNQAQINVFEDGEESRDFVYISDVIDAIIKVIESNEKIIDIFNVGSGTSSSVSEIANMLIALFGGKSEMQITGNFRIGDIRHNIADITKIKEKFGYHPQVSIERGLIDFVNWVKDQPVAKDEYEKSISELRKLGLLK